jgi:hypothetical protein
MISMRYAFFSTTGPDLASRFRGKNSLLSERYFCKTPRFKIWTMYVAFQNLCQNTPSLLTALKAGMLIQNKHILYVTLELCK